MENGFREYIHYDHACRNEGHANEGWRVQCLLSPNPGNGCYQDDPQTGPDGVDDARRHRPKRKGEQPESRDETNDRYDAREEFGKAIGCRERGGADDFGYDRRSQAQVGDGNTHQGLLFRCGVPGWPTRPTALKSSRLNGQGNPRQRAGLRPCQALWYFAGERQ